MKLLLQVVACMAIAMGSPGQVVAAPDQPDAKLAQQMVFEVTVQYAGTQVGRLVQPGFLVGEAGMGVTSYNALHSAQSARATFAGQPGAYEVLILRAEPSLDLALIRLKPEKDAPALTSYLKPAVGDLKDRQPVWTLQSSVAFDDTKASPGIVQVSSENTSHSKDLAFDAPGWIGGNVYQDRHTSGCPLVDERGRLIGVQVWSWPGPGRPVGLTAKAVDDIVQAYSDDCDKAKAKGEDPPQIRVSEARVKFHDKKLISAVFPQMVWDAKAASGAERAKSEAKLLATNLKCKACDGTGKANDSKKKGRAAKCEVCDGAKIVDETKFKAIIQRAADAIAAVQPGTDTYDAVLTLLADAADECAKLNERAFSARLNDDARTQLDPKRIKRGEAVMFSGSLSRERTLSNWDKDVAVIVPGWDAKTKILAIAPDDAGKLDSHESALIVGVVSGFVSVGPSQQCVVLGRVMVVPRRDRVR